MTNNEALLNWYRSRVKTYLEAVSPDLLDTVELLTEAELREMVEMIENSEAEEGEEE